MTMDIRGSGLFKKVLNIEDIQIPQKALPFVGFG
jgi:hypothetical protein